MITQLCRGRRLIVLIAIACSWTAGAASAQSLASVKPPVPVGDVVYVTNTTGVRIKGKLAVLTDDAVQVKVGADVRSLSAAEVRRIQWQQPDSPLTGVLIGAAVGAIPGIYWLIVDPNECFGMCPEEYAFVAIGAVIGGLIDRAIHKKVTVYSADGSSGRGKSVTVGPLATRHRKGVQVAMKF